MGPREETDVLFASPHNTLTALFPVPNYSRLEAHAILLRVARSVVLSSLHPRHTPPFFEGPKSDSFSLLPVLFPK